MMAIILAVAVADALVVMFVRRPFPWTVNLSAFTALLAVAFVILPMTRAERKGPQGIET